MVEKFKDFFVRFDIPILVIFIQFLQIFYLNTNITNYDGCQYLLSAREWAENGINLKSEIFYTFSNYGSLTEYRFNTSLLTILPLTGFFKIFGFNIISTQIYALLSSILIILLLWSFSINLFNKEISNLTILIYSLSPINAYMTASFLTDANSNLFLLIIVLCFYLGYKNKNLLSYYVIFFAGMLTLLSTFVRQWLPFIFVVNLLMVYFYFDNLNRKFIYYLLGCFIGLVSIFIGAILFTGDAFYFINIYIEYGSNISRVHFLESPLLVFPMLFHIDNFSMIFLLIPFFIVGSFLRRNKKEIFLIIWIFITYFLFEVLLRLFINLPKYHGYLNIMMIPLSIYISAFIYNNGLQARLIKYLKIVLIFNLFIILVFKYIDFSYFNYIYYSNVSTIRKLGMVFSSLAMLILSFVYFLKYKWKYIDYGVFILLALVILNLFTIIVMLSRSYETSIMIKSVELISEDKVRFYNLKNSEEPFRILCTNPTMLLPYYQQLLHNDKNINYEIKMVSEVNDLNEKKGYFLFVNKHSSYKWEPECFSEFEKVKQNLFLSNIPLTQIYDFGNYTLWKINY